MRRRPIKELLAEFRAIAEDGRGVHPKASQFLHHFLDAEGTTMRVNSAWLRGYGVVRRAERRNLRRFERSLTAIAGQLGEGQAQWHQDYWEARVNAWIGTELFYVSRMSLVVSTGSFSLTRQHGEVRIEGTVRHHWIDPYDWDRGHVVFIPRYGFVRISIGADLERAGEACTFLMESRWVHALREKFRWVLIVTE